MATTRTITSAWKNRYLSDVFYEQRVAAEEQFIAEREARQAERLEFEARERELLDELSRLRRQLNG